jgi:hypothetical protein
MPSAQSQQSVDGFIDVGLELDKERYKEMENEVIMKQQVQY